MRAQGIQDDLIDASEAVKILRINDRTLKEMIRDGLLSTVFIKRNKFMNKQCSRYFRRAEVMALAELKLKQFNLATTTNLAMRAVMTTQRVEKQLKDIQLILGIDQVPLRLEEEEVIALHLKTQETFLEDNLTADEVQEWAQIFSQIDEVYLRAVARFTADQTPWKLYVNLAEHFSENAPREEFESNKRLQAAYGLLEVARKQLRQVAYFYIRSTEGRSTATKEFPAIPRLLDESLINILLLH